MRSFRLVRIFEMGTLCATCSLVVLLAFGANSFAQSQLQDSTIEQHRYRSSSIVGDVSHGIQALGHVVTSPVRWDGKDWMIAGGSAAMAAGAFLLDNDMRLVMARNNSRLNDDIEPIGDGYGSIAFVAPLAISIYLSGAITDEPWLRDTGRMLCETVASVVVVEFPIRFATGRARPYTGEPHTAFKLGKGTKEARIAFPSGHAGLSFGVSTVLARRINNPYATVGLYALSTCTSLSRVYKDQHWLSDVVVGSLVGYFIGNAIVDWNNVEVEPEQTFMITPTQNGIQLSVRF